MFSVIRKIQGIEYVRETEDHLSSEERFKRHSNHIARFSSKPNTQPQDPQVLSEAYGARLFGKLNVNLTHEDVVLRRKSVKATLDLFEQKKENVISCLNAGILTTLVTKTIRDDDVETRSTGLLALAHMAAVLRGREEILSNSYVPEIVKSVEDTHMESRAYAFMVLREVSSSRAGAAAVAAQQCVPTCVRHMDHDETEVRLAALLLLENLLCVDGAHVEALGSGAMPALAKLLAHNSFDIVLHSVRNIDLLAFHEEGKEAAVSSGAVPSIVALLSSDSEGMREFAVSAVMSVTNKVSGKKAAIAAGVCAPLLHMLNSETSEPIILTVMKAMGNVSEDPAGRRALQPAVERLRALGSAPDAGEDMKEYSKQAIALITWTP